MKISEVEELVGITRRNIRFYEKEGLLAPGRNSENGYRDYGEDEVEALRKIKLLRKLDLPLEEIRLVQGGGLSLSHALTRHTALLERQQNDLEAMKRLCTALAESGEELPTLDSRRWLAEMELLEQGGTNFVNIKKNDTARRYIGPLVAAVLFISVMVALIVLMLWAFATDPQESPPLPLVLCLVAIPAVCIIGVVVALVQRFKQIKGGEEDAAAQY